MFLTYIFLLWDINMLRTYLLNNLLAYFYRAEIDYVNYFIENVINDFYIRYFN